MNTKIKVIRMEIGPQKKKHYPIVNERYISFDIIDINFQKELLEKFAPEIDDPDARIMLEFETCSMKNMTRSRLGADHYHRTKLSISHRVYNKSTNMRSDINGYPEAAVPFINGRPGLAPGFTYTTTSLYLSDDDIEFFKDDIYEAVTDYIFKSTIEIK